MTGSNYLSATDSDGALVHLIPSSMQRCGHHATVCDACYPTWAENYTIALHHTAPGRALAQRLGIDLTGEHTTRAARRPAGAPPPRRGLLPANDGATNAPGHDGKITPAAEQVLAAFAAAQAALNTAVDAGAATRQAAQRADERAATAWRWLQIRYLEWSALSGVGEGQDPETTHAPTQQLKDRLDGAIWLYALTHDRTEDGVMRQLAQEATIG